jgi:hypothetical protein
VSTESKLSRSLSSLFRMGLHRYALLAGLLLAFVGLVTLVAPTDPDVWWHLRDGKLILESGVPHTDVYSFTAYGRTWLVQEWLTEVVMYGIKSSLGYGALSMLFGLFQAAGGFVVYLLFRRAGAGRLLALLLLMVYGVFATPTWGVRPQVLTPIFLGAFYLILLTYRENPARQKLLWALPPLMALWANVHASYFMGIALIGAFIVGEFANNLLHRPAQPTPLRPLLVALAASFAATLINPYFVELWTYPLTYVLNGTSNPLLKYTQEWQPPNFHEPGNLLFGASIILLVMVALLGVVSEAQKRGWRLGLARRVDVTGVILFAAFTTLALQAVRLVPVYGVIGLPMLAGALSQAWPGLSSKNERPPGRAEGRLNWAIGGVGLMLAAVLIVGLPQAQTGQEPRTQTAFSYPVLAVNYLSTLPGSTKLYNDFIWGGYLIYRLYPQQKVFIDGRADMYRVGVFEDSVIVQTANAGWSKVLDKYGVDTALTVSGGALDDALSHESGWSAGYRDNLAVVYRKVR